jgi:hypothetical protein
MLGVYVNVLFSVMSRSWNPPFLRRLWWRYMSVTDVRFGSGDDDPSSNRRRTVVSQD